MEVLTRRVVPLTRFRGMMHPVCGSIRLCVSTTRRSSTMDGQLSIVLERGRKGIPMFLRLREARRGVAVDERFCLSFDTSSRVTLGGLLNPRSMIKRILRGRKG